MTARINCVGTPVEAETELIAFKMPSISSGESLARVSCRLEHDGLIKAWLFSHMVSKSIQSFNPGHPAWIVPAPWYSV